MSKIFGFYKEDENGIGLDKAWYDSSNVEYSECVDEEGKPKTLRVVFKNGTQYEYKGVDVNQYLLFREDASQGKALNKFIKGNKYEYEKLEDANLQLLNEELDFRKGDGMYLSVTENDVTLMNNMDEVTYKRELNEPMTGEAKDVLKEVIESFGHKVKLI